MKIIILRKNYWAIAHIVTYQGVLINHDVTLSKRSAAEGPVKIF
jgi:hypothetical protein